MKKLTRENLEEMCFTEIKYQMDDAHAQYFDAIDEDGGAVEIKIEKENNSVSYKREGSEDWYFIVTGE